MNHILHSITHGKMLIYCLIIDSNMDINKHVYISINIRTCSVCQTRFHSRVLPCPGVVWIYPQVSQFKHCGLALDSEG